MHTLYMILLWHIDAELVVILQGPPGQAGFPGNPGLPVGSWFFNPCYFHLISGYSPGTLHHHNRPMFLIYFHFLESLVGQ